MLRGPIATLLVAATLSTLDGNARAELPSNLVIVGGGKIPPNVRSEFVELAGGTKRARLVIIPTASRDADDPEQAESFLAPWRKLRPASVEILHTRDSEKANDAAFVEPLRRATGVWFSGGSQQRIVAAYRATRFHDELKRLLARGGAVGGTSAGAAIMSDPMIERGSDVAQTGPGMGFLPGVLVDQHFVARNRIGRLRGALADRPKDAGLGIDESTAIVVQGGKFTVLGDSTVTAIWPQGSQNSGRERTLKAGDRLRFSELGVSGATR